MSYDPANDRPYHLTIIRRVKQVGSAGEASKEAEFIIATACPANHDAIIAAWLELLKYLYNNEDDSTFGVIAALEAKKAAAEAKAAGERLRNNFDVGFTDKKS